MDSLRTPISWASARKICQPVDFGGLTLPGYEDRERGILSDQEVRKILALPVIESWVAKETGIAHIDCEAAPSPKEKGEARRPAQYRYTNEGIRLAWPISGLRRGELRGLRWGSVDVDHSEIVMKDNFQDLDGTKRPKAGSVGRVPIDPNLEPILFDLRQTAKVLGLDSPEDFVLMNPADRSQAIADSTLRRGWSRVLQLIGIDDEERERRHLVPHGTRHKFVTKLLDAGMSPSETGKLSRQKTQAVVLKYGDHLSDETIKKVKKALGVAKQKK